MNNGSEIIRKVKQWTSFGDDDLNLAKHALTLSTSIPYRLIAYHAQQCAEKYIKAYLIFRNIDFPFTHNIARLLELLSAEIKLPDDIYTAEELSSYAITTRYPGEDDIVSRDEAIYTIKVAEDTRKMILQFFGNEGLLLNK